MAFKKDQFIVDPRACIIPKGASLGDRRYRYKNYWCLTSSEKDYVRSAYPHKTPGIPDSAYAYPIDASGKMPRGRASRTLIWSRKRVLKKVNRGIGALPSWWPFKKPKKRHPMSHTVYMMKTKSGTYIPVDRPPTHAMAGARRRRKRR